MEDVIDVLTEVVEVSEGVSSLLACRHIGCNYVFVWKLLISHKEVILHEVNNEME